MPPLVHYKQTLGRNARGRKARGREEAKKRVGKRESEQERWRSGPQGHRVSNGSSAREHIGQYNMECDRVTRRPDLVGSSAVGETVFMTPNIYIYSVLTWPTAGNWKTFRIKFRRMETCRGDVVR